MSGMVQSLLDRQHRAEDELPREGIVTLLVEVRGARPVGRLAARLTEIEGVTAVRVGDGNHAPDKTS
jgi:hypothetical protein